MKKVEIRLMLAIPVLLTMIGLLELYSINAAFFYRQLLSFLLAIFVFVLFYSIHSDLIESAGVPLFVLSVLLLIAVLGMPSSGPKRWIPLGGFKFQPSELAKLATILILAHIFSKRETRAAFWKAVVLTLIPFGLTLIEPDLGTAAVFAFIGFSMAYLAGFETEPLFFAIVIVLSSILSFVPMGYILFLAIIALGAKLLRYSASFIFMIVFASIIVALITPVIWEKGLHDYQRKRITAFFQPEKFEKDIGWQTVQAHIALGSGGLTGKGFRHGTQKGLSFLPAAHTDFIFSSIGEEFGFIVCSLIIFLFLWWIVKAFMISYRFKNRFGQLLGYGVATSIYFHAFVNIGANLGLLPVVGLPLPFITYGGSHLIVEAAMLGAFFRQIKESSE